MNKISKFLISILVFLILVVPVLSFAEEWAGLVPCGKAGPPPCGFNDIMKLVDEVIKFILYYMVVPIAAIMFAYAGFELITSGGSTEKRSVAKKVFFNAVLGFVISLAAFLIVKLILSILGYTDAASFGF